MQLNGRLRLVACIAPLLMMLALASLVACRDANSPTVRRVDEWAEAVVMRVQLQNELTIYANGQSTRFRPDTHSAELPVIRGFEPAPTALRGEAHSRPSNRPRVSHFRDRSGKVHSIAILLDDAGKLPKRIYVFENGRIRNIVSSEYERHGRGYVRSRSRITFFGADGVPNAQTEVRTNRVGIASAALSDEGKVRLPRVMSDVLAFVLPRLLHAEETDGGCVSEWAIYGVASAAVVATTGAVTAASAACLQGVVGACALVNTAVGKLAASVIAWEFALERLLDCMSRQSSSGESDTLVSDGSRNGGEEETAPNASDNGGLSREELRRIVEQYVSASIAAGEFYCDETGDRCVFY